MYNELYNSYINILDQRHTNSNHNLVDIQTITVCAVIPDGDIIFKLYIFIYNFKIYNFYCSIM